METRPLLRRDISVDAVFDIETEDWDKFVVGGLYYSDGRYKEFDWTREEDMCREIMSIHGTVWAHAGGIFDIKWFLDFASKWGLFCNIVAAGSRIVQVTIGELKLCDSFALCPVKLKDFTEGQGVSKEALELPCICGNQCGGYCSISRTMEPKLLARLREYLRKDCISLFEALQTLRSYAATNDLDLGATIGSSAWRNAQRFLGLPNATGTPAEHKFLRQGYYGGRVQLYKPGLNVTGHEYDVNSMYPWALKTFPVPIGDKRRDYGASAKRVFLNDRDGIYQGTVTVPESHLPPLPFRYNGGNKTAYPYGTFASTYTLPELQYAISLGCEFQPHECVTWERTEQVFGPWIDRLFALRLQAPGGKKSPMGTFVKLYMNSLTGKLGSNPDRDKFVINPSDIRICTAKSRCAAADGMDCGHCCEKHCSGKCGAHTQYSERIFFSKTFRLDPCSHVQWTAYVTSHARITLNKQQRAFNDGYDCIYSDTDSLFAENPRTTAIGKGLGEWDYAGQFTNFVGIAPKCYYFERDGKLIRKAKGIKLPAMGGIIPGNEYQSTGIVGFRAGAKLGTLFKKRTMTRKLSEQPGDRIKTDYGSRAPHVSELV